MKNKNKEIYQTISEGCNRESQPSKKEVEAPDRDIRGWFIRQPKWFVAETPESCGRRFLGWFMGNTRAWNKAFTLIELLVVVLIIGILAAIAVPQYQKAVLKSRMVQVISFINSADKAMSLYVLSNGYENIVPFTGKNATSADIDFISHLDCSVEPFCEDKYFWYVASIEPSDGGYYTVEVSDKNNRDYNRITIDWKRSGEKEQRCSYEDEHGKQICQNIVSLYGGDWEIIEL